MQDIMIGAGVASVILARKVAFSMVVHWTAHFVENTFGSFFQSSERKTIIHNHYLERARGQGHETKDVTMCREEPCALLTGSL